MAVNLFTSLQYSNEANTAIQAVKPDGSVRIIQEIDEELWQLALAGSFGNILPYVAPPEPDLEDLVLEAMGFIDRKTGEFRRQFITDIPGQQMTYLRKQQVAKNYLSEVNPKDEDYPRIMAAVGVVASTAKEVAEIWNSKGQEWEQIDVLIESRREAFKKQAAEASSQEELKQILEQFKNWSM